MSVDAIEPANASQAAPAAQASDTRWFYPFAIFVVNSNLNSGGLLPGSWAAFALPEIDRDREQFNISPANTLLGADFRFPNVGETAVGAKVSFNFRGASPLANQNTFALQFFDLFMDFKFNRARIALGQTGDVISPLVPSTLNSFPVGYTPGSLGYVRPQIRGEATLPAGGRGGLIVQAALAQAIQTFDIPGQAVAAQSGWPDVQGRAAYALGDADALGQRPFEVGVSGHFGERSITLAIGDVDFRNTYSFGFDARVGVGSRTKLKGEYYTGQLVGDYMGAIFQTFDPISGTPVDAQGFWVEAEYGLNATSLVHLGYGYDNVEEEGGIAQLFARTQSANLYANLFHGFSPELSIAGEFAYWRTRYRGLGDSTPLRFEISVIYKWLGR